MRGEVRIALVLAFATACGGASATAEPQPKNSRDAANEQADQVRAAMEQRDEAAVSRQRQVQADSQAETQAALQGARDRRRAEDEARAAKETADRKACDDTRSVRHQRSVAAVKERLDGVALIRKHAAEIRRSCRLSSRVPGAVDVTTSNGTARVRPVQDDVQCGALPAGITKRSAWFLLTEDQAGYSLTTGPVLDASEADGIEAEDRVCRRSDTDAGLDVFAVTYEDPKTFERMKAWRQD